MIENKTNLSPINIPPFVLNDLLLKKLNVISKVDKNFNKINSI